MSRVAHFVDAVVGGDTHVDTTSLCVVSPVGAVLAEITIDNDEDGYAQAVTWVLQTVPSERFLVGLEGTRSYGAGLCRALQAVGIGVVEVERPSRGERGRRGKSDAGDALLAANKVLAMPADRVPQPRAGDGVREALRLLSIDRETMTTQRTRLINQLLADLLTGDAEQQALRKRDLTTATLRKLAGARGRPGRPIDEQARMLVLRRRAQEILRLDQQIRENEKRLRTILVEIAPQLLEQVGVGPVVAAQLIVSYSHRGRCRSEAAFAALAGVSPIEASSGRITRHRLNRGGDRRLNRALHIVAVTRARQDPRTRAYIQRRSKDLTDREIRRMLKRYIIRDFFKVLQTIDALDPAKTTGAVSPAA
jgi:transposase